MVAVAAVAVGQCATVPFALDVPIALVLMVVGVNEVTMQNWFLLFVCIIAITAIGTLFTSTGVNSHWLHKAVKDGDTKAVPILLAMGADVRHRARYGGNLIITALPKSRLAKHEDRKKIIKMLVAQGLSPLERDRSGLAPIHYVVMRKYSGYAKFLASLGADLNQPTNRGLTPLMFAIRARDKTLTKELLDAGADPRYQNHEGKSALHFAVEKKSHLLEFLLSKVKDINIYDNKGYTPLTLALNKGYENDYKLFLKLGFTPKGVDEQGWTPLHYACEGKPTLALTVLKNTQNPAAATKMGLTPLHIAAAKGHRSLCEELIKRSVPVDALDSKKRTPLYYTLCSPYVDVARMLVSKGANVTSVDEKGRTLLHTIAAAGSDELVCFMATLIEKGVDIEAKDNDGRTALHLAAKHSYIKNGVSELLSLGADPKAKDKDGKTPAQLSDTSVKSGLLAAASYSVSWRGTSKEKAFEDRLLGPPLYAAVRCGDDFLMQRMLKKNRNVNEKNRSGRTALHYAAELGKKKLVDLLLKNGAKKKVTDNNGKTPSQLARENGHGGLAAKLDTSLEKN